MIINLKALSRDDYIRCVINKIDFSKTMFVYDIAMGWEVFIPRDLSQDIYPKSFRYYDPIF